MLEDVFDSKGFGDTYIFNVKLDEISEIEEFIRIAKQKKRIDRMGGES